MNLEAIDPDRLLAIAQSGSPAAMATALSNVSKALKGSIGIQEAWEAAGGNPGIKATKAELLEALRMLDEVCDEADAMKDALEHIVRRLQMDIDDGSRPDQWSMEDLVLKARKAIDKAKPSTPSPAPKE